MSVFMNFTIICSYVVVNSKWGYRALLLDQKIIEYKIKERKRPPQVQLTKSTLKITTLKNSKS